MTYLMKYGKAFLFFLGSLMILLLLLNTLSYFNVIGNGFVKGFSYVIFFVSYFISGFVNGKYSKKKGWLEGLKFGFILLTFIQLINFLIFKSSFSFPYLIFEIISLLVIVFGSMIGINKKNN